MQMPAIENTERRHIKHTNIAIKEEAVKKTTFEGNLQMTLAARRREFCG
jgi:hypothetical protein